MSAVLEAPASVAAQRRDVFTARMNFGWLMYFIGWTLVFSAFALWMVSRHYINDGALSVT